MTDYPTRQLEKVRERIENADIVQEDRDLIEEFDTLLAHDGISKLWHSALLGWIGIIAARRDAHNVSLAELSDSKEEVLNLLEWIKKGEYYDDEEEKLYEFKEKTQTHYRTSLRKFGRLLNGNELPQSMEIIYGGDRSKVSASTPKKWEVLLWNPDCVKLIKACENLRDVALIAVAWDSGARPFEILDLTYGDISPDGDFLKITVGGKNTPLRDVRLVIASPYLKKWLEQGHPVADGEEEFSPDTPIWTKLNKNKKLWKEYARTIIPDRIAPRTDLDKPTNMRNF